MDDFIKSSNALEVLGIRIGDWNAFLRLHSDQADLDEVSDRIARDLQRVRSRGTQDKATRVMEALQGLIAAWTN